MKLIVILFSAVLLLLIGGFAYLAMSDVPVETTQISKTISNDRFFDAN